MGVKKYAFAIKSIPFNAPHYKASVVKILGYGNRQNIFIECNIHCRDSHRALVVVTR